MQDSITVTKTVSVADQVNSVIDNLSQKLSVPASKLFEVLTRQSYAVGVADLLTAVVFVALIGICSTIAYRAYKKAAGDYDNPEGIYFVIGTVLSVVLVIPFIVYFRDGLTEILNPQYYAVKFVLEALRPTR